MACTTTTTTTTTTENDDITEIGVAATRTPVLVMNVHPPWAKLLIKGAKTHENRTLAAWRQLQRAASRYGGIDKVIVAIVESKNGGPASSTAKKLIAINEAMASIPGARAVPEHPRLYSNSPGCIIGYLRFEGMDVGGTSASPWATQNPDEFALRVKPGSVVRLAEPIPCAGAQTPFTRFGPKRSAAERAFAAQTL
jgi:hypothetical protein